LEAIPNKAVTGLVEYPRITLNGFPLEKFDEMHYAYGELFLQLYPATDWEANLKKLNKEIDRKDPVVDKNNFKIKHVTANECGLSMH
jgi:hypothetical protein